MATDFRIMLDSQQWFLYRAAEHRLVPQLEFVVGRTAGLETSVQKWKTAERDAYAAFHAYPLATGSYDPPEAHEIVPKIESLWRELRRDTKQVEDGKEKSGWNERDIAARERSLLERQNLLLDLLDDLARHMTKKIG